MGLAPFKATWPNGATRLIESGSYLITSITNGVVRFRKEVPSDMACGEDIKPPRVMAPILRPPATEFFWGDWSATV
jgi:hypothetical protein